MEVGQAEPWIVKSSDPSSQVNMISRSDTNDTKEVSPVGYFQPSANRVCSFQRLFLTKNRKKLKLIQYREQKEEKYRDTNIEIRK